MQKKIINTIKITEGSTSYETSEGKGVDLVFLHGFPFNETMWRPQIDSFGTKYRVIAPDFRHHGKSSFKNLPWTLSHLADDLKELLDGLDSKHGVLCGLSMGGYVALEFATKYPAYLKGLILCDTKADTDSNEDKEKRMQIMKDISLNGNVNFAREFSKKCIYESSENEKLIHEMIIHNEPFAMINTLLALSARKDQRKNLPGIHCPTLILCGEKDLITPPSDSEELHKGIKDSEYFVIPKAGHLSNLQSATIFSHHLQTFLEKIS